MVYTEEDIREDLLNCSVKEFYMKYLLRADNWYFEKILEIDEKNIIHAVDDFNNVVMVGSAKTGYSLSPKKFLKTFSDEGECRSDIDIAIVSPQLFDYFWKLFRDSYDVTKDALYKYISRGIYRGYISDMDLHSIDRCRAEWLELSNEATRQLQRKMYFKHEIHYRMY